MATIDCDRVFNAVQTGNINQLKILLDNKRYQLADIKNVANSCYIINPHTSTTLLGIAAGMGHLACVDFLLEQCHANVDGVTQTSLMYHHSPLSCAAINNEMDVVDILLRKGANVNAINPYDGETPLKGACTAGNFIMVKLLIYHYGADVEIATFDGNTCLMIACELRFVNIVKYLIDFGRVDVNRRDFRGITALHYAARSNSLEIVMYLLNHNADLTATDTFGNTPLSDAILNGHVNIACFMITLVNETEKIHGYELLGAIHVERRDYSTAVAYWKHALNERQKQNPIYEKKYYASIVTEVFNHSVTEFKTTNDLDEISSRPDKMRVQALLVRDRILSLKNPYNLYYIFNLATLFEKDERFLTSLKLYICYADVQLCISDFNVDTNKVFIRMLNVLFKLFSKKNKYVARYFVRVFKMSVAYIERLNNDERKNQESKIFEKSLTFPIQLLDIVTSRKNLELLSGRQICEMERNSKHLVTRLNPQTLSKGYTLLHLACLEDSFTNIPTKFPNTELLKWLRTAGADTRAKDNDDNTPYYLFMSNYYMDNDVANILFA